MSEVTSANCSDGQADLREDESLVPLPSSNHITQIGLIVESGCLLLAIGLSFVGFYDHRQPLVKFFQVSVYALVVWTIVAVSAISISAVLFFIIPAKPFRDFRAFIAKNLGPIFAGLSAPQIAIISASAGLGEEMLFRWCLQGGLQNFWPSSQGIVYAVLVASLVFGLAHALTAMYVAITAIIGVLLGAVMVVCESVIPCILAHAIYDFFAILILQRTCKDFPAISAIDQSTG